MSLVNKFLVILAVGIVLLDFLPVAVQQYGVHAPRVANATAFVQREADLLLRYPAIMPEVFKEWLELANRGVYATVIAEAAAHTLTARVLISLVTMVRTNMLVRFLYPDDWIEYTGLCVLAAVVLFVAYNFFSANRVINAQTSIELAKQNVKLSKANSRAARSMRTAATDVATAMTDKLARE